MVTNTQQGEERVKLELTVTREAFDLLDMITRFRFPSRVRVKSLIVEQLIREEAKRIEEENRRQQKS